MIKIAHRGNTAGTSELENSPERVLEVLSKGYDVEVDAWYSEDSETFMLGHDEPQYKVSLDFLKTRGLWVHCKEVSCFRRLLKEPSINCFMHDHASWVRGIPAVTSHKYLWFYTEVYTFEGTIVGICGDEL